MFPHLLKKNTLSVFAGGKSYAIDKSNPAFAQIVEAVHGDDLEALIRLTDVPKTLADTLGEAGFEGVVVHENHVSYKGRPVSNYVVDKIFECRELGLDLAPLVAFLNRLLKNPSFRAVQELYRFLEASDMPITSDGCFLAYKVVRSNYLDKHSGTIRNMVGDKPRMERNEVDEDSSRTCSHGLHVCSKGYIRQFRGGGDHLMLVKVDPADVVAVPDDYNDSKMRTAGYEVIDELSNLDGVDFKGPFYDVDDEDDGDDEDYDF